MIQFVLKLIKSQGTVDLPFIGDLVPACYSPMFTPSPCVCDVFSLPYEQSYMAAPGQMYSIQEQSHYQQNITGQAEYQVKYCVCSQVDENGNQLTEFITIVAFDLNQAMS